MRDGFLYHLQIVEVEHHVHLDLMIAQKLVHFSPDRKFLIESDKLDAIQLGRRDHAL